MSGSTDPITRDHVEAAVQALQAAGRRASWREVRKHLGRGSPNTILAFLRERDAERRQAATAQEPAPPAAITDLVGSKVWQAALAAAREQMAAERQELEARLRAEEERCGDLAGQVERLEEQLFEARRQADAQIDVLRELARQQQQEAADRLALRTAVDGLAGRMDADAVQDARRHQELAAATVATQVALATLRQEAVETRAQMTVAAAGHAEDLRIVLEERVSDLAVRFAGLMEALAAAQASAAQTSAAQTDVLAARLDELHGTLRGDLVAERQARVTAERESMLAAQALAAAKARTATVERAAAEREQEWQARWDVQRADIQRGWGDLRTALAEILATRTVGLAPMPPA